MLYFLVTFIALTAIKQCNFLFSPQAAILHSADSCPFTYLHHGYYNTACVAYGSFNVDPALDCNLMGSISCLYIAGHTHKAGGMTHNVGHIVHKLGLMTHNADHLIHNANSMTHNSQSHVATSYRTNKPSYHNLTEKAENCNIAIKQQNSMTLSIYSYPIKHYSNTRFDQKEHKPYRCSALPLILAINQSIYYLLNSTFNQASDINHLINRLLLILCQHMTRHNDFKHFWFTLLLSGLLRSRHICLWFLNVCFWRIHIVVWKLSPLQKITFAVNLMIDKIKALSSCLHFIYLCICIKHNTLSSHLLASDQNTKSTTGFFGGGRSARTDYEFLKPYVVSMEIQLKNPDEFSYVYGSHCTIDNAMQEIQTTGEAQLVCNIPLALVANILTSTQANEVAKEHNVPVSRMSVAEKRRAVESHICTRSCNRHVTLFKPVKRSEKSIRQKKNCGTKVREIKNHPKVGKKSWGKKARAVTNHKYYVRENIKFPPLPPSKRLMHKIITGFCNDTHLSKFEEAGCAVCGQLLVMTKLIKLTDIKCSLDPLVRIGVTRLPRNSADDPIKEIEGPIIDVNCKRVCHECVSFLGKKVMPPMALANGLWVGNVPKELSDLTFVERLLVARVRSNRCIVHVLKGGWKMRANAIMFPTPLPKLCNILPPPIEELDEVIAFMFTGVAQPTAEDMKRTPMLARRRYISAALEWLKINHSDYADVQISQKNLNLYPEEGPPVTIDYRSSVINKHKEATSVFDMEDEDGVREGKCPFVVHGITGENYSTLSKDATRALALQHLIKDQNILFVGHGAKPESMFNNSQLFPSMMPWLFPYGLGGIGNSKIIGRMSSIAQKKYLLMYHDKRFQIDPGFPLKIGRAHV